MKVASQKLLAVLLAAAFFLGTARSAEIHDAAEADDAERITAILATNRDLVHLRGKDELTPLHSAARVGKMKALALLLERGADVNAADAHGCTPLHSAVYGKHTLVAEFLLDHKASVDAARTDGTPPLYYAVREADTNTVSLLLKRGAKPDVSSEKSFSPLHAAAEAGHVEIVELLVAAGANVEAKDKNGQTPLHIAAKAGKLPMVEWLLSHGADAEAKDRLRFQPVDYVVGGTNAPLASLLERHMKSRQEQAVPAKVGEAGDPDHIVFEGLETFTAGQIRHALTIKPSYLLASHPQANMGAFLDALKTMVESGYQAAGFPDARAEVRCEPQTFRVHVNVTEGPRFIARKITVVGTRSVAKKEVVRWFTMSSNVPEVTRPLKTAATSKQVSSISGTWEIGSSASLTANKRPSVLNTPGKAERPEDPMWVAGDPADFSAQWATQAVAQVEACLAEQGFFFPTARVELQRNSGANTADLTITITEEGPPGVIGKISVTGLKHHAPADVIRFLNLREGKKITAERLAAARQKLRDCGRFWDFEITPEYAGTDAIASRRVGLHIEVKEQEGVPWLNEPLSREQVALLHLCKWIEQLPEWDDDLRVTVTNQVEIPFAVDFFLSPKRGLLLNSADLDGHSPLSACFLVTKETVEFCAWASSNKMAAARGTGRGQVFLHLLPDKSGGTNRFSFTVGAGYSSKKQPANAAVKRPLEFDVQLTPAAFFDSVTREGTGGFTDGGTFVLTNDSVTLRSEAATGRLLEISSKGDHPWWSIRLGGNGWERAVRDSMRHSAALTNCYKPGHGLSSFLTLATTEVIRGWLTATLTSNANPAERAHAVAAIGKLVNTELFLPMDQLFSGEDTNHFSVPMDDVDRAIGQNSVAAFFSGFAFGYCGELFPKYSWPWTVARESAFVMMSQGRYTDVELERLYGSEATGPVGCLVIAGLLTAANVPAAKSFASAGLTRLNADSFLRDCDLFLHGESGLARSFARTAEALRNLPEEELAALIAILPPNEADLLRESADALRARPNAAPAAVLTPALKKYWEESLRAKVTESLRRITEPTGGATPSKKA